MKQHLIRLNAKCTDHGTQPFEKGESLLDEMIRKDSPEGMRGSLKGRESPSYSSRALGPHEEVGACGAPDSGPGW